MNYPRSGQLVLPGVPKGWVQLGQGPREASALPSRVSVPDIGCNQEIRLTFVFIKLHITFILFSVSVRWLSLEDSFLPNWHWNYVAAVLLLEGGALNGLVHEERQMQFSQGWVGYPGGAGCHWASLTLRCFLSVSSTLPFSAPNGDAAHSSQKEAPDLGRPTPRTIKKLLLFRNHQLLCSRNRREIKTPWSKRSLVSVQKTQKSIKQFNSRKAQALFL